MDPLPKPTLRRKWLRWLALPAAAGVLALAYYLTRPSDLVWWRSPDLDGRGHRLFMLVPSGWGAIPLSGHPAGPREVARLQPYDSRPQFLRRLFPRKQELAWL